MKAKHRVWTALGLLAAAGPAFASGLPGGESYKLTAAIYHSPPMVVGTQFGIKTEIEKNGAVRSGIYSGMITDSFPEAVALLALGGREGFSEKTIQGRIAE